MSQRQPLPLSQSGKPASEPAAASLSVRLRVLCGGEVAFGPGKAELLNALEATGSITKAARALGVSYMHAWSLIQTMNRCFSAPLVQAARGGQKGGGAGLTAEGRAALALYREMAAESLKAAVPVWERLRGMLKGAESIDPRLSVALANPREDDDLMEQSIRNELPGTIKEIISDKVISEVIIDTPIGPIASVITTRSVRDMGLKVGDKVAALVKATNVSVRREQ